MRTVRDHRLETRGQRERLPVDRKPRWRSLIPGLLHLGYKRRKKTQPGVWVARRYVGRDERTRPDGSTRVQGRYREWTIGAADDFADADGELVLSFADAQRRALEGETDPLALSGTLTVADAVARYTADKRAKGQPTAGEMDRRAALHITPSLGHRPVDELRTAELTDWRNTLASSPALLRSGVGRPRRHRETPDTPEARRQRRCSANKIITILKAALNHAYRLELMSCDDRAWRNLESFEDVEAARPGHLTIEQAQRLMNASEPTSGFRDLVTAALLTGARYGELCRLRVRDFDGHRLAIHVTKTGKPRSVILHSEARDFFEQITAGRKPDDMMLPNRRLKREWRKSEQTRPMREACGAARLEQISFHSLRHTWASLSVMNGVPMIVVATNLGHTTTRVTEKNYAHLSRSYMDKAIEDGAPRFGVALSGKVTRLSGRRKL